MVITKTIAIKMLLVPNFSNVIYGTYEQLRNVPSKPETGIVSSLSFCVSITYYPDIFTSLPVYLHTVSNYSPLYLFTIPFIYSV